MLLVGCGFGLVRRLEPEAVEHDVRVAVAVEVRQVHPLMGLVPEELRRGPSRGRSLKEDGRLRMRARDDIEPAVVVEIGDADILDIVALQPDLVEAPRPELRGIAVRQGILQPDDLPAVFLFQARHHVHIAVAVEVTHAHAVRAKAPVPKHHVLRNLPPPAEFVPRERLALGLYLHDVVATVLIDVEDLDFSMLGVKLPPEADLRILRPHPLHRENGTGREATENETMQRLHGVPPVQWNSHSRDDV